MYIGSRTPLDANKVLQHGRLRGENVCPAVISFTLLTALLRCPPSKERKGLPADGISQDSV